MLSNAPSYNVHVLRRENSPYEQMSTQHGTSYHHKKKGARCEYGKHGYMPCKFATLPRRRRLQKQQIGCRDPPNRTSPVIDKSKEAHHTNVISTNSIICVGKIYRGDSVGATECKKRGVLDDDRGNGDLATTEIQRAENV